MANSIIAKVFSSHNTEKIDPNWGKKLLQYDKIMLIVLLAHLPVVAFLVPIGYDTFMFSIIASAILAVAIWLAYATFKGTAMFGILSGPFLMTISAIMIQAELGRLEMHFHIFGALALPLLYRDWRPLVAAAGFIAVHHLLFTGLQLAEVSVFGMPIVIYNYGCSWGIAFLHAAFVIYETAFLMYYAYIMSEEQATSVRLVSAVTEVQKSQDLSIRVPESADNEVGTAFNALLAGFEQLLGDLRSTMDHLSQTSAGLLNTATETSANINSQHDQIAHARDAMSEMSVTIRDVAKNAQEAAQVTTSADREAAEGATIVQTAIDTTQELVSSMNEANEAIDSLKQSAQSIGSVVDVIRDISEQTNLLALNAAIEAARAGEQGRGFAVVSDEVRVLAQRTQKSTQEIQDIIESLQAVTDNVISHINTGRENSAKTSEDIARAGAMLNGITGAVSQINDMNTQNASSAEEQSVTAKTISENIQEISDFSSSSLTNIESNQRAAEQLEELASSLREKIAVYKTSMA